MNNLKVVRHRIRVACLAAGRDENSVRILPITKSHPAIAVEYALQSGLTCVGENKVQEALRKAAEVSGSVSWELVGHLQSNKAKFAAQHFNRVQSVDSEKLLRLLAAAATTIGRKIPILLQVNTGNDPSKFGADEATALKLMSVALEERSVQVDGLMTIAPRSDDPSEARRSFARLRLFRDQLELQFGKTLPELSMGMSGDFEDAIREGSTLLRLGTALFAERPVR